MKGISLLKFLSKYLDRNKLDISYKLYVRHHLEYGDVIFHQRSADLMKSLESVQYRAGLIVAGCWKGTSKIKLYKELGWESLSQRRTFHRLSLLRTRRSTQDVQGQIYVPGEFLSLRAPQLQAP